MGLRNFTLGIIGVGNMGEALLGGVIRSELTPKNQIFLYDVNGDRLERVVQKYGVRKTKSSVEVVQESHVVLIGVKPQDLTSLGEEIEKELEPSHLIISILAGVPVSKIRIVLGAEPAIVRIMPNLPALVGHGISVVANDTAEQSQVELVKAILEPVGEVVDLPEEYLDAVTALSGSGPGFVCLFIEALADAGVAVGLPQEAAQQMAMKTFMGTSQLLDFLGESPGGLRQRVTSKGGTTEAGLKTFEEQGLRSIFKAALGNSTRRAQELGQG